MNKFNVGDHGMLLQYYIILFAMKNLIYTGNRSEEPQDSRLPQADAATMWAICATDPSL